VRLTGRLLRDSASCLQQRRTAEPGQLGLPPHLRIDE
jgi:hypothetical protein